MSEDVWTPDNAGETKAEVKVPEILESGPHMALMPPHPFDIEKLKESLQPEIIKLKGMVEESRDFKVVRPETHTRAIEMASQMAKLVKSVDGTRKELINPYGLVVKEVNAMAKMIKDLAKKATRSLKDKLGAYSAEQAELQRRIAQKAAEEEAAVRRKVLEEERKKDLERQERERKEAIERQKDLDAKAKAAGVEAVEVKIPEVVDPGIQEPVIVVPKEVAGGPTKTEEGTSFTVKTWKFNVISLDQVPNEFILKAVDSKSVKAAIDAGVREIPGLKIYEHSDVRIRTK